MVARDAAGPVIVDISIDQGGCFETSHVTTHSDPTYVVHGVVHYCVGNMPGAVPHTSTYALTNVTLPYALAIAERGLEERRPGRPALALGVNVYGGAVTNDGVARGARAAARRRCDEPGRRGSADGGRRWRTPTAPVEAERYLDHLAVERGLSRTPLHGVPPRPPPLRRVPRRAAGIADAAGGRGGDDRARFVASLSASDARRRDDAVPGVLGRADAVGRALVPSVPAAGGRHRPRSRRGRARSRGCPRSLPRPLSVERGRTAPRGAGRGDARSGCGTARSSSCCTGRACGSPSSSGSTSTTSTSRRGACGCSGKGGKEREVPLGRFAPGGGRRVPDPRRAPSLAATRRSGAALFLNQRGGRLTRQGVRAAARRGTCGRRGSGAASRRTRCGTRSRRICWRAAPTSAWCRSCSGTRASPRRRSTPW